MNMLRHFLDTFKPLMRRGVAMLALLPAVSAAWGAEQGAPVKTDSLPPELRAAVALIESTNKLNETALELIRSHVPGGSANTSCAAPRTIILGAERTVPAEAPQALEGIALPDTVTVRDTVMVYTHPVIPGGQYVWIPDSMQRAVRSLLAAEGAPGLVLHEDTVARNIAMPDFDKDPEVLRDRNLGRFHRGLFNYRFLPKGQWVFGLTANYGEFSTDDLEMFSVLDDVTLGGHTFSIKPQMQYLIRDNMAVGLRFNYTQTRGSIDNFGVEIDEDMNFNLHDISYKGESYAASLTFTQYLGLARRGRFGIFNEAELSFSSGNSDFVRPFDGNIKTTHTTTTGVGLNFSPGVTVFMMKQASFNISFGVFGFYLKNEKQWVDGEESGNRLRSGANFRFNIFNINFGIAVHI